MLTLVIIAATCVISVMALNNRQLMNNLIFFPPAVNVGRQWYRLFTYGVLHANYTHLFFNMFTFYFFGTPVENVLKASFGTEIGSICFLLLYISALPISILPTYFQQRENSSYYGVGASGAVSAFVFAYVLVNPMNFMGIMFIPIWLPAFLFAIIFIVVSVYLDKHYPAGINHLAHLVGGAYGIVFMIIAFFAIKQVNLIEYFINQIKIDSLSDLIHFGF